MAGKPIGPGGSWRGVLDGITCDQDFLRLMFQLTRGPNTQLCCHLCDSIQWISNKSEIGPLNNVELLYTVYGPRESDTRTMRCCFLNQLPSKLAWSLEPVSGSHLSVNFWLCMARLRYAKLLASVRRASCFDLAFFTVFKKQPETNHHRTIDVFRVLLNLREGCTLTTCTLCTWRWGWMRAVQCSLIS